ncbi:MAG: hypothetical protein RLZZ299_2856 [Pseudomonadota bacterium]|jgi:tRNA (cytidine32/uridine32-2'-O)-methyltransferase
MNDDAMNDPSVAVERALREDIVVVLVRPLQSGNIGATARAMKNMGLRRLVVVAPRALDIDRARWMAPGAAELLDQARWVTRVEDAVADCHHVFATTARGRHHAWPATTPDGMAARCFEPGRTTGILFGPEDAGLDNDDLAHAHTLVHIPTDVHASLNVGQAVLLVAASVFTEATRRGFVPRAEGTGRRGGPARGAAPGASRAREVVPAGVLDPLVDDWLHTVDMAGFLRSHEPLLVEGTLRRLLGRAELDAQEVSVLRGMLRKLRWRMEHGEPG